MPLPDWLYKKLDKTETNKPSSMGGSFSLRHLIRGENPFSALIPQTLTPAREKKRVILTDFTLPLLQADEYFLFFSALEALLKEGFQVILPEESEPEDFTTVKLTAALSVQEILILFNNFMPLSSDRVGQFFKDYTADGDVLLDYARVRELIACVTDISFELDIKYPLEEHKFSDVFARQVIPCLYSGVSLEGHSLPEVVIDEGVLNHLNYQLSYLSLKVDKNVNLSSIHHWGFTYVMLDMATLKRCLENSHFPIDKIKGINIITQKELDDFVSYLQTKKPRGWSLPAVTKIWLFSHQEAVLNIVRAVFPNAAYAVRQRSNDSNQEYTSQIEDSSQLSDFLKEAKQLSYTGDLNSAIEHINQLEDPPLAVTLECRPGLEIPSQSREIETPDLTLQLSGALTAEQVEQILKVFPNLKTLEFKFFPEFLKNENMSIGLHSTVYHFLYAVWENVSKGNKEYLNLLECLKRSAKYYLRMIPARSSELPQDLLETFMKNYRNIVKHRIEYDRPSHYAQQRPALIFDGANLNPEQTDMLQSNESVSFHMIPVCQVLEGGVQFSVTRNVKFDYDFSDSQLTSAPLKRTVLPNFSSTLPPVPADRPLHKMNVRLHFTFNDAYQVYCARLPGLTAKDMLCHWKMVSAHQGMELKYSISDNFYYLICLSPPLGEVRVAYDLFVPLPVQDSAYENLAQPFRKNFEIDNRPDKTYSLENAALEPQYYDCGQRVAAFLYAHRNHPIKFWGNGSATHAWVETPSGSLDLGGRPAEKIYEKQSNHEDFSPIEPVFSAGPVNIYAQDVLYQIIEQKSTNSLFLLSTPEELEQVRAAIIRYKKYQTIVVDTPHDLNISNPYITLKKPQPKIGKLPGGFLFNNLGNPIKDILLIDWSGFSGRALPQGNTCVGKVENRKIEQQFLDKRFHVIGLALKNSAAAQDKSHLSRHKGNVYQIFPSAIPPAQAVNSVSTKPPLVIELHHSPEWSDKIIGKVELLHGEMVFQPGPLLTESFGDLVIKNPPIECLEFQRFVTALREGLVYQFYDRLFNFSRNFSVTLENGFDYSAYNDTISAIYTDVVDSDLQSIAFDQVLNPSTFDKLLHDTHIDEQGNLHQSPGWLDKGFRHFYLTRTLPEHQLCALLDEIQEDYMRVPLTLYCAPGVVMPAYFNAFIKQLPHSESSAIRANQTPSRALKCCVNITGISPDQVLFANKAHLQGDKVIFKEEISDVFLALLRGEPVLLSGEFSAEMIDQLSSLLLPQPYLWHQNQKKFIQGKLFLGPTKPIESLTFLTEPGRFFNFKFPGEPPVSIQLNPGDDRTQAVISVLKQEIALLIQGPPGIGKSCFARALANEPGLALYSENNLEAWADDIQPPDCYSVLIIDEASSRNTNWCIFDNIDFDPPQFMLGHKIKFLRANQKIIFLGNPLPQMPSLFERIPSITFAQLEPEAVMNQILIPIFGDMRLAQQYYSQSAKMTLRQLQFNAISWMAKQRPRHQSFSAAAIPYHFTPSRMPVVQSLMDLLNARHFRMHAVQDAAKYGGQTGLWLEGPAGIGKTDLIRAVLNGLGYQEGVEVLVLAANMAPLEMMKLIREAFHWGKILVIDELDTALNPEMVAEINAFMMGENLNFDRPARPGFTLLATGNGPTYAGRMALPESLRSRMVYHELAQYPLLEARDILNWQFARTLQIKPDFAWVIEGHLQVYSTHSSSFSFREVCDWLSSGGHPQIPNRAPVSPTSGSAVTQNVQLQSYQTAPGSGGGATRSSYQLKNLVT